jgi:hypothetical protein
MQNPLDIPIENIFKEWIEIEGGAEHDNNSSGLLLFQKKIDVLERLIEVVRFRLKYPQNKLPIEEFLQSTCSITFDTVRIPVAGHHQSYCNPSYCYFYYFTINPNMTL